MLRVTFLPLLLLPVIALAQAPPVNATHAHPTDDVVLITYPIRAKAGKPATGRGVIYHREDCFFLTGHRTVKAPLAEVKSDPKFVPCDCMTRTSYLSSTRGQASPQDMAKWAAERPNYPPPFVR